MTAGRLLSPGAAGASLTGRMPAAVILAVTAALAAVLACAGVTLLARRLGGGFAVAPRPELAWILVAVGGPLVLATTAASRVGGDPRARWLAGAGLVAGTIALVPVGGTIGWPARAGGVAAVAAALATTLLPPPVRLSGVRWRGRSNGPPAAVVPAVADALQPRAEPPTAPVAGEPPAGWVGPTGPGLRQRLERFETAGGECLRGLVAVPIPAGSRHGHAHVGFCPSFAGMPVVEVSTDCDVVEAVVSAAEVLPWGVRIECRLGEQAEESLEIAVAIEARHPA